MCLFIIQSIANGSEHMYEIIIYIFDITFKCIVLSSGSSKIQGMGSKIQFEGHYCFFPYVT